jgi:XTP/dITP diphosphohydrolase
MTRKETEILIASGNQGKLKEFEQLLQDLPVRLVSLKQLTAAPEVVEDGASFLENARKKAQQLADYSKMITLADDSGLEVDCLQGAPGVLSARFAGENSSDSRNNQKLLRLLEGVPLEKRTARFKCCLVLAYPGGRQYWTEGECEGLIGFEPKGNYGFGYDPLFYLPELNASMGEISPDQKNSLSHRARALQKMRKIVIEHVLAEKE